MKSNFQVKKISNYDAGYPEKVKEPSRFVVVKIPFKIFSLFLVGVLFFINFPGCGFVVTNSEDSKSERECETSSDCPAGYECDTYTGECVQAWDDCTGIPEPDPYCLSDSDCPDGYECYLGDCEPKTDEGECALKNIGKTCTTDNECGNCIICSGGKCILGCLDDDDCQMHMGLKCNKELARCLNVFGSLQACNETNCPTGCCYAEKGLQGLHCLDTPTPGVCGLCPQGQVYDGARCIPAVCSTTIDACPTINQGEAYPVCWECKSGEFICVQRHDCPKEEEYPDHCEVNDHEYPDDFLTELDEDFDEDFTDEDITDEEIVDEE